jgi:hypothetical protein
VGDGDNADGRKGEAALGSKTVRAFGRFLARGAIKFFEFLSSEWLLTRLGFVNGGGVVTLRASLASLFIYLIALALRNGLDPERLWVFSSHELKLQIANTIPWFGATFAVAYAGFYARFASQWTYLAEMYNQIKSVEASTKSPNAGALAEWKAGFLEDADSLHLAAKPSIASIVRAWLDDCEVQKAFSEHAPDGREQLKRLMAKVGYSGKLAVVRNDEPTKPSIS